MTTTGTVLITDNQDQTRLITISSISGASGTSPAFTLGNYSNAMLAVQGTWSSATMVLNGSWDGGTTWIAVKDLFNNAISITANGAVPLGNLPPLLQLSWSGGTTPALTAYISLSRPYI